MAALFGLPGRLDTKRKLEVGKLELHGGKKRSYAEGRCYADERKTSDISCRFIERLFFKSYWRISFYFLLFHQFFIVSYFYRQRNASRVRCLHHCDQQLFWSNSSRFFLQTFLTTVYAFLCVHCRFKLVFRRWGCMYSLRTYFTVVQVVWINTQMSKCTLMYVWKSSQS